MRRILVTLLIVVGPTAFAAPRPTPVPTANDGLLGYDVRDAATGEPMPCKLTFVGVNGTPSPHFTTNDIGRQEGDAIAAWDRVMSSSGQGQIRVATGTYDIWISRGPEWDVSINRAIRIGGRPVAVTGKLKHVVDTRGWLSGDFHVHAAASSDSQVPMQDRIYEFLSDGVEMIVSTDHNTVSDYAPIIAQLGLGKYIASAPGDEMTTGGWGHFGAFPLTHDLERAGQGALLVHGRTATDFFADVRRIAPLAVIDVHHPRIDEEIGYFNLARFDAHRNQADKPGFSFDFDAIEVLNGYQDSEQKHVDRVIEDWFALIDHGHLVTATGNSDTHHLDHNIGGYPRNYVEVHEDDPSRLPADAVPKALLGHHSFFTTAPFVRFRSGGATIGDLVPAHDRMAHVDIEVQAAPWVTVSSATLYLDGKIVQKIPIPLSTNVVRLKTAVDLPVARDAYVVLRVDGNKPLAPIVGDQIHFDVRPFALTNPIFFDVDGNGRFDAIDASPAAKAQQKPLR